MVIKKFSDVLFWLVSQVDKCADQLTAAATAIDKTAITLRGGNASYYDEAMKIVEEASAQPREASAALQELPDYHVFRALFMRALGTDGGFFVLTAGGTTRQYTCDELYNWLLSVKNQEVDNTPATVDVYNRALDLVLYSSPENCVLN